MNILEKLSQEIIEQQSINASSTVIMGFSGGPDSVFLLYLLHMLQKPLNLTLITAHLDHGWRKESANDALFCQQLAEKLGITCIIAHAKDIRLIKKPQGSREELGRLLRKQFFEELAQKYQASYIALAHHFDDQMETFFLRLIRGTGVTGLAGMKMHDGLYFRPLLDIAKKDILTYLDHYTIPYRIDVTNTDIGFLRNNIRHTVIPALKKCDNRFEMSFKRTHNNLQQAADFIDQCAQTTLKLCSEKHAGLSIEKVLSLHPFLRYKVLELWLITHQIPFIPSAALYNEIIRFLKNKKSNHHDLLEKVKLVKNRGFITLQKT